MGLGKPKLCAKFEVPNFNHCINIEGEPKLWGALLAQGHATPTLSSACDYMMGLGKFHIPAKFEVVSPSRCRNITGEPKILGAPLAQALHHCFLWVCRYDGPCKPKPCTNLKSLCSAVAEILKGKPQIAGSSPSPGPHPPFLLVGFDDGLWQTLSACQIWSCWIHLLRKYKGISFKTTNSLFEPPFGGVRDNVRTSSIACWKARSRFHIRDNWTFSR